MTEEQAVGFADVVATFPDHVVDHEETADGGLLITVRAVEIGSGWSSEVIDLAVKLQVTFPSSIPYPFYCAPGLARTNGQQLNPIQPNVDIGGGVMRTQISLTVSGQQQFDITHETVGSRFVAVIAWLRGQQ